MMTLPLTIIHCSYICNIGEKMALRLLLMMAPLLFCIAMVSSDAKIEDQATQLVTGPNRRLLTFVDFCVENVKTANCGERCKARCRLHSRQKICTRACMTCCARCKCVPPGTYGNREACGKCYADMVTHGNKPKCP